MKFRVPSLLILATSLFFVNSCNSTSAEDSYSLGQKKAAAGDRKGAYLYFKKAAQKNDENATYHWAAALTAPDQNAAFLHTKAAWEKGMHTREALMAYSKLSFFTEESKRLQFALTLFAQLPDSLTTPSNRADLLYQFAQSDSALALWKEIHRLAPSPVLCDKIALALVKLNRQEEALATLQGCGDAKMLDHQGYVMLAALFSIGYRFKDIDTLFEQARQYGEYDNAMQVEHAGFLCAQGRFDEAEEILKTQATPPSNDKATVLDIRARINLAYLYLTKGDAAKASGLSAMVPSQSPAAPAEKRFYEICALLTGDSLTTPIDSIAAELGRLRTSLPPNPFSDLVYARALVSAQKREAALKMYQGLVPAFLRSAVVLPEFAGLLLSLGKTDEAATAISLLHGHNIFTRRSMEVYREIALRKKSFADATRAQDVLEKKFPQDARVAYDGGVLALREGNYDKAIEIFSDLAKRYPDRMSFEISRLLTFLLKQDFAGLLKESQSSRAPAEVVAVLRARAHTALKEFDAARVEFEKALAAKPALGTKAEYAEFLMQTGKQAQAAGIYESLASAKDLTKDSAASAMVFNNLAWALMNSGTASAKTALSAAEKAYKLSPANLHILDTYSAALGQSGNAKECIKVIKSDVRAEREPGLLCRLAAAYEQTGDVNLAVRTYRKSLELADSTRQVSLPITKEEIAGKIAALTAEK